MSGEAAGDEALPRVSFVIPTLNAERYLKTCLDAIRGQDYPQDRVEIVIADGGSVDRTQAIAEDAGARVVHNAERTAEAGKAVGVAAATGELLGFVDSDNEIIGRDWLRRMVVPFGDPDVTGSEALRWAYVRRDGLVNRYCALTGINDPTSLFVGNYGRWSWLTRRWTDYPVRLQARPGWQRVEFTPGRVPTMGANGYLVRTDRMRAVPGVDQYVFDIDAVQDLVAGGERVFARVDVEIRHQFARGVRDFARKTRRRAQDFLHHRGRGERRYAWPRGGIVRFALATVLVVPLLVQVARGMRNRPDAAWLFHPVACWVTLLVYAEAVMRSLLGRGRFDRSGWRQ